MLCPSRRPGRIRGLVPVLSSAVLCRFRFNPVARNVPPADACISSACWSEIFFPFLERPWGLPMLRSLLLMGSGLNCRAGKDGAGITGILPLHCRVLPLSQANMIHGMTPLWIPDELVSRLVHSRTDLGFLRASLSLRPEELSHTMEGIAHKHLWSPRTNVGRLSQFPGKII